MGDMSSNFDTINVKPTLSSMIQPVKRQEAILKLYEQNFPVVASFVRKMGGTFDEAKDVFHDALIIFYEKKEAGESFSVKNENGYLLGIAKHIWYKHHRQSATKTAIDPGNIEVAEETEPKISGRLIHFVEQSGKKCLELLSSFYYEKLNMSEISVRFGFSGERSATVQKYKCLEKIRNAVSKQSLKKVDFYE